MTKAIGCISGGLDSTLAVALMKRQGIEVVAMHVLHLWHPLPASPGETPPAIRVATAMGVRAVLIDAEEADLDMVQHPAHGLGKRMNPCIDCRIWALRKAKELMEAEGAVCVFTGEVIGQRPMSQNRGAMNLIEREAGLEDLLLRPLSALHLPPTRAEREGLVDRSKLKGIIGRSRKEQMALAAELGITDYPSPAGGCLVTDPAFSFRLKELMRHSKPTVADVQLLKVGRHFRLADGTLLAMGRFEKDNALLERLFQAGDVRIEAEGVAGPTTLLRGAASPENIALAASLTLRYIKGSAGKTIPVVITPVGGRPQTITVVAADDTVARQYIISPEEKV
jgi:tRNA U34 2-thiouridine synthase MnmA/TrmU